MKIYDCFTFFNELDLLEIRLSELYDFVDYFVIVEGNKSFSGKRKDLIFEKNAKRFSKWKDKIIYLPTKLPELNLFDKLIIKLLDSKKIPKFGTNSLGLNFISANLRIGRWKFVYSQRDAIINGLGSVKDEDIIMFSDLDEIPKEKEIKKLAKLLERNKYVYFKQKPSLYYINGIVNNTMPWIGTIALKYKTLKKELHNRFSYIRNPSILELLLSKLGIKRKIKFIDNGGWHFAYLGGAEKVFLKSNSIAESKGISPSKEQFEKMINDGVFGLNEENIVRIRYIPLDSSFPNTILKNKKKYSHLIRKI